MLGRAVTLVDALVRVRPISSIFHTSYKYMIIFVIEKLPIIFKAVKTKIYALGGNTGDRHTSSSVKHVRSY